MRVLRPSSLTLEVIMAEEWEAAAGIIFLFRSPSSSCDEEREVIHKSTQKQKLKLTYTSTLIMQFQQAFWSKLIFLTVM